MRLRRGGLILLRVSGGLNGNEESDKGGRVGFLSYFMWTICGNRVRVTRLYVGENESLYDIP